MSPPGRPPELATCNDVEPDLHLPTNDVADRLVIERAEPSAIPPALVREHGRMSVGVERLDRAS